MIPRVTRMIVLNMSLSRAVVAAIRRVVSGRRDGRRRDRFRIACGGRLRPRRWGLGAADQRVSAGLEMDVGLGAHLFDEIDEGLEPQAAGLRAAAGTISIVLRADAGDDVAAGEGPGLGAVAELELDDAVPGLLENEPSPESRSFPWMKFMGGLPRKPATKRLSGLW
jgi:hypothetical protein